jgi:predicted enzyme related to lactoylglutathione lyase
VSGAPCVVGLSAVAVDCADPAALAAWWQQLLGGRVEVDDDGDARLTADGFPPLDFLRVPEPKTVKNRLHLDLATSDLAEATAQVLALGAVLAPDVHAGDARWVVLRDPEGNELCLIRPQRSLPSQHDRTSDPDVDAG